MALRAALGALLLLILAHISLAGAPSHLNKKGDTPGVKGKRIDVLADLCEWMLMELYGYE